MKKIIDNGLIIDVDDILTRKLHANPDYYVCQCSYCRNFCLTIKRNISKDLLKLIEDLGIDIQKPSEAVEFGMKNKMVHYIVDYHFVGGYDISTYSKNELNTETLDYAFFKNDKSLADKSFDPYDIVALRVNVHLPWNLKEDYEV